MTQQRRRVIQAIWRRAPSLSLHSRMESLRRAQQLVMLGRILDTISAEAAGIVERDTHAAATQKGLSPVINAALGNLEHKSDAGSADDKKSGSEETSAKSRDCSLWLA